jgi:signal transduction histidine kinase
LTIELLHDTKRALDSIRNLTELARVKFSDQEFGDFFYRSVTKDIGETNFLLEVFSQYLSINTPLKKKDTVHKLIEEVLKKYHVQLKERGIKLSKKFEKDLPETIVPDEPLRYILNSILQYGVKSVTPNGDMEFLTKSFILRGEMGAGQPVLKKDMRTIEIKVFFTGYKKPSEPFEESRIFHEEEQLNLILRLVKEVVRKHRGIMEFETDKKKEKALICIRFPAERREVVYYQPREE